MSQADQLEIGDHIGDRYEVKGYLGGGGMATVYAVRDTKTSRDVAIKLLNPALQSVDASAFDDRFAREAQAASAIEHPSTVSIFGFGFHGETRLPFVVMERLSGHDLKHELDHNGPMEPERVWPLVLDTLEALGQGHARGIVHKDLKPENLLLTQRDDGREHLVVVDFGVARVESSSQLTAKGQVSGTPQYMAPEYITAQTVTPALDVYQMALILIEMLSGRPVVDTHDIFEAVTRHTQGNLPIPPAFMDGPLGPVLVRALHVDHTQRYTNASELRDAIAALDPDALFTSDEALGETGVINAVSFNSAFDEAAISDTLPPGSTIDDVDLTEDTSEPTPTLPERTTPTTTERAPDTPATRSPIAPVVVLVLIALAVAALVFLAL